MLRDALGNTYLVVDAHVHFGRRAMQVRLDESAFDVSAATHLQSMDSAGIDMAVIFPTANPQSDYSEANSVIIEAANQYPERFIPYGRVQPATGPARSVEIVEELGASGAKGLKLNSFMDGAAYPANDLRVLGPILEAADGFGMVVTIHSGESLHTSPALIADLASSFPNVTIVVAHSGMWGFHEEAIVAGKNHENLYLDTAELYPPGAVLQVIREAGASKVLFGSDYPYISNRFELAKVAKYLELADSELAAVLGGNAQRLLGLGNPTGSAVVKISEL